MTNNEASVQLTRTINQAAAKRWSLGKVKNEDVHRSRQWHKFLSIETEAFFARQNLSPREHAYLREQVIKRIRRKYGKE